MATWFSRLKVLLIALLFLNPNYCSVLSSAANLTTLVAPSADLTAQTTPIFVSPDSNNNDSPEVAVEDLLPTRCRFNATDPLITAQIKNMIKFSKLIQYNLIFPNYSANPLIRDGNRTWTYNSNRWTRLVNTQGRTLLSLGFNYGVLSLMTLTFGVENITVKLEDIPGGCVWEMSENETILELQYLLMRDFKRTERNMVLENDESVCHQVILTEVSRGRAYAKFTDSCCYKERVTNRKICRTDTYNIWITILDIFLETAKFAILLFGPLLFIRTADALIGENMPYIVKLKEALLKRVYFCRYGTPITVTHKNMLDLRGNNKRFDKFKKSVADLPIGEPIDIKISQYDILVDYSRLQLENEVDVGLFECIKQTIFACRIREIGPFRACCETNMFKRCSGAKPLSWIKCWSVVALIFIVLFLPAPLYGRILIFYFAEAAELFHRIDAAKALGLSMPYEGSLMHFFTPTHPLFVFIYVIYFVTAIVLAYVTSRRNNSHFKMIFVGAFRDLKNLDWIANLEAIVANTIYPLSKYGLYGVVVGLIYWPIMIPLSLLIYVAYCIPTFYVSARVLYHTIHGFDKSTDDTDHALTSYQIEKQYDYFLEFFKIENLLVWMKSTRGSASPDEEAMSENGEKRHKKRSYRERVDILRCVEHMLAAILCVVTLYGILLILCEIAEFLIEMAVFTLMGVIVNAGILLQYVTLLFLVLVYSYDSYNNVPKEYLRLNKALFGEVKGRIKDLDKVTSLPSHLQENFGFKSQELSEQGDYESPDGLQPDAQRQWFINDLVIFVDNNDTPRIPKQLFEEVCSIRVAGAPGPVYQSLLTATKSFLTMVLFLSLVFIVVRTFSSSYNVSGTNQMLATAAGGFLPMVLRTFMQPSKPIIELGTVSFKSKLDEIIKNFSQIWPMFDFPFKVYNPDEDKKPEEVKSEEIKKGEEKKLEEKEGEESKKVQDEKDEKAVERDKGTKPTAAPGTQAPAIYVSSPNAATPHPPAFFVGDGDDAFLSDGFTQPPPPPYPPNQEPKEANQTHQPPAAPRPISYTIQKPTGQDSSVNNSAGQQPDKLEKQVKRLLSMPDGEVDILVYLPDDFDGLWAPEWSEMDELLELNETSDRNDNLKNDLGFNHHNQRGMKDEFL